MKTAGRFITITLFGMAVTALGLMAQTPPGGAWLGGPVQSVGTASLVVQGLSLQITESTHLVTIDANGIFEPITIDAVTPGNPFQGRMIIADGVPTLTHGYVGTPFFWHGVVTALNLDEDGNLLSLELDNTLTVNASQAVIIGKAPGSEGDTNMDAIEAVTVQDSDPFLLQVGSTVGVAGISRDGVFSATLVNVAAVDFASRGTIGQVYRNDNGHVIGFDLNHNGATRSIHVTIYTRIMKGRHPASPDSLKSGQRVKVVGKVLADDTVLSYKVKIVKQ